MFILEGRRAETNVSINNGGHTQGEIAFIEAAVKDTARFASTGGWGYFSFDSRNGLVDSAAPLPATATCYACHAANTAVDNTFVQFYPELFAVAKAKGTVKAHTTQQETVVAVAVCSKQQTPAYRLLPTVYSRYAASTRRTHVGLDLDLHLLLGLAHVGGEESRRDAR